VLLIVESRRSREWLDSLHNLRTRFWHGSVENGITPARIAVLDTGIDDTNPYVQETWGKKYPRDEGYRDFLEDEAVASGLRAEYYSKQRVSQIVESVQHRARDVPHDSTGHGTHVAGIVLQLCPEAKLYVGRVLEKDVIHEKEETRTAAKRLALVGSLVHSTALVGMLTCLQAILYTVHVWKVKIISLSIGFRKSWLRDEELSIVQNAIAYATESKVMIFAAASNAGNRSEILFPASEPELFCINSSDGYGNPSKFNSPHREFSENFSILGEGVKSTWLQNPDDTAKGTATLEVHTGTSVATPIAASAAAIILHFGRQWEPEKRERLEVRRGMLCILKGMATKKEKFYDIVPWRGVFDLTEHDEEDDPIGAAMEKFKKQLKHY
jgi:subtilisin family serine protease